MSAISLNLFKDDNVYVPGEKIVGTVDCIINSTKTISAIKVILKGKGKTTWTERQKHTDNHNRLQYTNVEYFAKENYICKELILKEGETELPSGTHTYSFAFVLPLGGLPSSYEGSYGRIRYHIKAVIVRSWDVDLVHKLPLQLSAPLNLNDMPHLRSLVKTSADKTMCSCFCRDKGILVFDMTLPITGFVPGQDISVFAHVQNLTNVNVEKVQFKIVEYLEFIARDPSTVRKQITNVIVTRTETGIGAHGEKSWTSTLKLPIQGNYPNFNSSTIMKVFYCLKAKAIVSSPHNDLDSEIPIVIGGVPLTGVHRSLSYVPPPIIATTHSILGHQVPEPLA